MVWVVIGALLLLLVAVSRWAFRRGEAEYRLRTGESRPDRHDPGEKYVICHANGGGG